jgi:hypothetical protein
MVGNRFFKLTTFKMTFRDRTVVRQIDVSAVYAVAGRFESLVRKIDVLTLVRMQKAFAFLSILKIIWLDNNKFWFIKRHFSNLDDENFERVKINHS